MILRSEAGARFGSRAWIFWLIASMAALYGAYVVAAGFGPPPKTAGPQLAPGFVGSRACAECHPEIAAEHAESHHARTLRLASEAAKEFPVPPPRWVPDPDLPQVYRIVEGENGLAVETQRGSEIFRQPLEWAFGSGAHALTFVGRRAEGGFVESAVSAYRHTGWDFTPGFLGDPPARRQREATGHVHTAQEIADCFHCHAAGVRRNAQGVVLDGIQFGVQCESCHGPGEEHVRQARAGRSLGNIWTPGQSSAQSMVTFCGTCHRTEPPPGLKPTDPAVIRFAPVGLQQSRCFRESDGRLSCVTCHDPHGNARKEPEYYRDVCRSCHSSRPAQSVCPVRPSGDCVSCHMPRRIVQRNIAFTDHWIRVLRETVAAHADKVR